MILGREGVQNVVAISYPVMADSAEFFVTALYYAFLLQGQGLSSDVALARNRLRSVAERDARFYMKVNVNDVFVPVLYQTSHELVLVRKPVHDPSQDLRLFSASRPKETLRYLSTSKFAESFNLMGREDDLLSLGNALTEVGSVRIIGKPWTGRLAFRNFLKSWWIESHYLDCVFEINHLKEKSLWDRALVYRRLHPRSKFGDPSKAKAELHASSTIILIDNFEIGLNADKERSCIMSPKQRAGFRDFIRAFLVTVSPMQPCRLVLFSSTSIFPEVLQNLRIRTQILHPVSRWDGSDLARKILNRKSLALPRDDTETMLLEELLWTYEHNALFMSLFLPFLSSDKTAISVMWEELELGLPQGMPEQLVKAYEPERQNGLIACFRNTGMITEPTSCLLGIFGVAMNILKKPSKLTYLYGLEFGSILEACQYTPVTLVHKNTREKPDSGQGHSTAVDSQGPWRHRRLVRRRVEGIL